MNTAPNRRKLEPLRRAVTYIPQVEAEWLESAARARGWPVSRFLAQLIDDAHQSERWLLAEMEQERRAMETGA
jgi:hypothetical protein